MKTNTMAPVTSTAEAALDGSFQGVTAMNLGEPFVNLGDYYPLVITGPDRL